MEHIKSKLLMVQVWPLKISIFWQSFLIKQTLHAPTIAENLLNVHNSLLMMMFFFCNIGRTISNHCDTCYFWSDSSFIENWPYHTADPLGIFLTSFTYNSFIHSLLNRILIWLSIFFLQIAKGYMSCRAYARAWGFSGRDWEAAC